MKSQLASENMSCAIPWRQVHTYISRASLCGRVVVTRAATTTTRRRRDASQLTVHPQEYDTDKGGGQLDYVISAKRRDYYEYALGALIIYLLA